MRSLPRARVIKFFSLFSGKEFFNKKFFMTPFIFLRPKMAWEIWRIYGNGLELSYSHYYQQQTAIENVVGKEEIARNEQYLLFPQCFLLNQIIISPFVHIFDIVSLLAADLEEPKSWHMR